MTIQEKILSLSRMAELHGHKELAERARHLLESTQISESYYDMINELSEALPKGSITINAANWQHLSYLLLYAVNRLQKEPCEDFIRECLEVYKHAEDDILSFGRKLKGE